MQFILPFHPALATLLPASLAFQIRHILLIFKLFICYWQVAPVFLVLQAEQTPGSSATAFEICSLQMGALVQPLSDFAAFWVCRVVP
jgi:hypothetical protein